jgi:hypothetical protein
MRTAKARAVRSVCSIGVVAKVSAVQRKSACPTNHATWLCKSISINAARAQRRHGRFPVDPQQRQLTLDVPFS